MCCLRVRYSVWLRFLVLVRVDGWMDACGAPLQCVFVRIRLGVFRNKEERGTRVGIIGQGKADGVAPLEGRA